MKPKAYSYIRFSSPEQEHGDSERRQLEAAEQYAKENGLTLDDSLIIDRGLSGYKGTHRTKGALGQFLKKVEEGQIPKGSVLIVEDMDRLGRENWEHAIPQLMNLMLAEIRIYLLQKEREIDKSSDWDEISKVIDDMKLAHWDSEKKSKRAKAAWEQKRKINDRKHRAPKWLTLSNDRKQFTVISNAAKTIKQIFKLKLSGYGSEYITTKLNTDPVSWKPDRKDKTGNWIPGNWRKSYVQKILSDRAVLGEYQPHILSQQEGRYREPEGEVMKGHYPGIVSDALFDKVQYVIEQNRVKINHGAGQTGQYNNLFAFVVKCGRCGSPMHYEDKGKKSFTTLRCRNSKERVCKPETDERICNAKAVRYKEFETIIFNDLEELDFDKFVPSPDDLQKKLEGMRESIEQFRERLQAIEKEIERYLYAVGQTENKAVIDGHNLRLEELYKEQEFIRDKNKELESELIKSEMEKQSLNEKRDKIKEYNQLMNDAKTPARKIKLRYKIRQEIQRLIEKIRIYPMTKPYKEFTELDTGDVLVMKSRFIERIAIDFKSGSETRLRLLPQTHTLDLSDPIDN